MTEPFRPVPGRRHRTRDGRETTALRRFCSDGWYAEINGAVHTWYDIGSYFRSEDHPLDLVAVIDEPAADTAPTRKTPDQIRADADALIASNNKRFDDWRTVETTDPAPVIPVPSTQDQGGAVDERVPSPWPDPTPAMLKDETFLAIWSVIKSWDVNVPSQYTGYCGATGNHARAIYEAIIPPTKAPDVIAEAGASAEEMILEFRKASQAYVMNSFTPIDKLDAKYVKARDALRAALSALPPREAAPPLDSIPDARHYDRFENARRRELLLSGWENDLNSLKNLGSYERCTWWVGRIAADPRVVHPYDTGHRDWAAAARVFREAMIAAAPKPPQTGE